MIHTSTIALHAHPWFHREVALVRARAAVALGRHGGINAMVDYLRDRGLAAIWRSSAPHSLLEQSTAPRVYAPAFSVEWQPQWLIDALDDDFTVARLDRVVALLDHERADLLRVAWSLGGYNAVTELVRPWLAVAP